MPYKPAAVRAFYIAIDLAVFKINFPVDLDYLLALDPTIFLNLDRTLYRTFVCSCQVNDHLSFLSSIGSCDRVNIYDNAQRRAASNFSRELAKFLDLSLSFCTDRALEEHLKSLQNQLPKPSIDVQFEQWWKSNGKQWKEELNIRMIEHRNIGHDWQFSESQKELLQKYCDANKLLVDCLKSECYANRQILQHIEDTLLLPLAEIPLAPL